MYRMIVSMMVATLFFALSIEEKAFSEEQQIAEQIQTAFEPFTGKITREKVRMRLQPSLESPLVKELNKNDLLVILSEVEGFYAIQPPPYIKGYVYRTYVLDGLIEGNKVNVRLAPHLEAPIIAQLNAGDKISGIISSENNKWFEIALPRDACLYVAVDYVEKVGDVDFITRQDTRKKEVSSLLNETYLFSQSELQKPFQEINADKITANYRRVIDHYKDFPEQNIQAKECLAKFQDSYLHKKIAYLEARTKVSTEEAIAIYQNKVAKLEEQEQNQQEIPILVEDGLDATPTQQYERWVVQKYSYDPNSKMLNWMPIEIALYENWASTHPNHSIQDFYEEQVKQSVSLKGILEPFDRPVRNKPGDYLLVNRLSHLPIAYLYSTNINLQEKVGQEISLEVITRPNNYFAYPAYFVISVE